MIDCTGCPGNGELCDACREQSMNWLASTAACRGGVWAEGVVRKLRGQHLERWPGYSGKAKVVAERKVADLSRDMRLRAQLAVIAYQAAAERYEEARRDPVVLVQVLGSRE